MLLAQKFGGISLCVFVCERLNSQQTIAVTKIVVLIEICLKSFQGGIIWLQAKHRTNGFSADERRIAPESVNE